jgi:aconitate hydratase
MGVLPLQFKNGDSVRSLAIRGDEEFDILGLEDLTPQCDVLLRIRGRDGSMREVILRSRIDTPAEVDYYVHGGILPYVLRGLFSRSSG